MKRKSKKYFLKKFGSLIENQRAYQSTIAAYWKLLILIRWTLTSIILIFLRDYNQFQIIALLILSVLFSCLIISAKPFEETIRNKLSLITESIVSIHLYILICFSEFIESTFIRKHLPEALLYTIAFNILIDFIVFGKNAFQRI